MEASAIRARAGVHRRRVAVAAPLLRLRSDQQLVAQFRAGNEDAFRVIHDRYRARLLAYVRQMLHGMRPDAEDTLQEVFVRAYAGLRAGDRELSLRPWLYRIAHNRCVDVVRRPVPTPTESLELTEKTGDPVVESEQRESLRRLVTDIRRLPEQQRSALLMRELGGVAYADIAAALDVSVPAVKSLLVRSRMGLAAAFEARDTACELIRQELADAHDRGVRPSGIARRHLHDCGTCREYRAELRSISRQFAALAPAIGPLGLLAKLLGAGGSAGGGVAAGGGALAAGGAAGAGGTIIGVATSHVAALVAAAVVTAGGAVELQRTVKHLASPAAHHAALAPARYVDRSDAAAQQAVPVAPPHAAHTAAAASAQISAQGSAQASTTTRRVGAVKSPGVSASTTAPSTRVTGSSPAPTASTSSPAPVASTSPAAPAGSPSTTPSCQVAEAPATAPLATATAPLGTAPSAATGSAPSAATGSAPGSAPGSATSCTPTTGDANGAAPAPPANSSTSPTPAPDASSTTTSAPQTSSSSSNLRGFTIRRHKAQY